MAKITVSPDQVHDALYYVSSTVKSLRLGEDLPEDDYVCGFVALPVTLPPEIVIVASSPSREEALDALGVALQTQCAEHPALATSIKNATQQVEEWRQEASNSVKEISLRMANQIRERGSGSDPVFDYVMQELASLICDLTYMLGETEITPSKVAIMSEFLRGFMTPNLDQWNNFLRGSSKVRVKEAEYFILEEPEAGNFRVNEGDPTPEEGN